MDSPVIEVWGPERLRFRTGEGTRHSIAYYEWRGAAGGRAVFCVHGLSRNAKDFRALAQSLCAEFRVVCPDVVGRGDSDRLADPRGYNYPAYASDLIELLEHLRIAPVSWVGTSMGGILGMMVASSRPDLVRSLVLNDIGAVVDAAGVRRILGYVGKRHRFAGKAEAMSYIRDVFKPFGIATSDEWEMVYDASFVATDGGVEWAYDPAIVSPVPGAAPAPLDYWAEWSWIRCPVLILRGAESDLLSRETVKRMCERPGTRSMEIPNCGHAPALLDKRQIGIVSDFLREH